MCFVTLLLITHEVYSMECNLDVNHAPVLGFLTSSFVFLIVSPLGILLKKWYTFNIVLFTVICFLLHVCLVFMRAQFWTNKALHIESKTSI